ncbi:YciI family protein [Subtercola endophyticus]|uniref:YciI family protein n=1 Tax=Subtercola endophyticus TaxID=2895559 RepID=UPI001E54186F|nr:transcription initiation protein [Subtercola endophyticus]UFS59546.1 transcription initiation protein [Subtercola endophyticus]
MTFYLISFPSAAMQLDASEFAAAERDSHAVIAEMKLAGVYRFGGGIDEDVAAVQVAADGTVTQQTYSQSRELNGGMTIIDVDTREEALEWARKTTVGCRTVQELRQFMDDPAI